MYAIIRSGGRQFRVSQGDVLRVPLMEGQVGGSVEFGDILLISDKENPQLGSPTLANAKVRATIVRQGRERKILVYTYKRRKGYEKRRGHRQSYTEVRIDGIDQP